MNSLTISLLIFACVFGGALLGMFLRAVLHERHLSADSKDVVKLGTGLIRTMTALVLGLLIASAKERSRASAPLCGALASLRSAGLSPMT